ncbi:MAG TPA: PAS domain-containing protein [Candidatus Kapabacteria bacterium]|nr:PAS domain-containing protein [Candidatus Kapabacteria bacterium]
MLVLISVIVRWLLDPHLETQVVFVTMFPAVAAAVWIGGVRCGVLAVVLCAAAAFFIFLPPRFSFAVHDGQSMISLLAFLFASSLVIAIGHNLQQSILRSRGAEDLLQGIIDGLPALVSLIDRDLRYCLVNAEYSRWFGVSEPEMLGKTMAEVIGAEAFRKVRPQLDRALKGETVNFRDYLPYAHGGGKWVEITYRPHLNSEGQVDGVVVLVLNVSEQHHAQQALAEREREFRAIFELNATGTTATDPETGRFTLVNEKFCEVTGYTREELLNKGFADITHPDDKARDRELFRSALQSHAKNWEAERRYIRKDGEVRWVAVRGTIIRNNEGKAVRTLATVIDLTDSRRSQQALVESERRVRQALDAGKFGAWEWVIPENRVIWSDRLYEIHGVKREEFRGDAEQFKSLIHPEDWDHLFQTIHEAVEKQIPYEMELRAVRPDGQIRWIWTTAHVFYENNQPFKMVGVTADVTERKEIELQLRESEDRLRLAQRAAKVGTWDWLIKDGRFLWSEGLYDLLGLVPDKAQPSVEVWMNHVHPEDRAQLSTGISMAQRLGGPFSLEFRIIRSTGEMLWLLSMGRTDQDSKGEPVRMLGVTVDITERKKAEELLHSQAQHLEELVRARTERLQEAIMELESFSYTIAHDLRGPLRAMNGFATALLEEYSPRMDDTGLDYLRRITSAAERMDQLICDVLDYSKITRQRFVPEPVELDSLIDGILDTYPALTHGEARVSVHRPLPVVLGTPSLIVQCFSNLIGNAVKFVPEGTVPRITIRPEVRDNGKVRVWVEDNGIGIPFEHHGRIFGLFQRLNSKFEGTGIGLAIVGRAVERLGGTVGLESEEGKGSRFWVELSLAPQKSENAEAGTESEPTSVHDPARTG